MARLYLKKNMRGFDPADEPSIALWKKFKLGEIYRSDIVKPRSYRHHCLAMALLQLTFDNQSQYTDFETFRKAVARAAGHVIEYVTLDGEIVYEAASLSYDAIPDDIEFGKIISKMMTVCANLLHDIGLEELEVEVARYADEHYGQAAA